MKLAVKLATFAHSPLHGSVCGLACGAMGVLR